MNATLIRRPQLPAPQFHGITLTFGDVVTARNPFGFLTTFAVRVWGNSKRGKWVGGDCGRAVLAEHITCVERDGERL
jgi:hypothetical protein